MVRDNQFLSFLVLSGVGLYSALLIGVSWTMRYIWLETSAIG